MQLDRAERERRQALVAAHYDAENDLDLEAIMATMSPDAEMIYNGQRFPDPASIRWAHSYMGMSPQPGAFSGLKTLRDQEHFTTDEVVVEGRVCGRHVGEFQGFAPTQRDVELPFVAFYRFDAQGLLTSERVVMNLGALESSASSGR